MKKLPPIKRKTTLYRVTEKEKKKLGICLDADHYLGKPPMLPISMESCEHCKIDLLVKQERKIKVKIIREKRKPIPRVYDAKRELHLARKKIYNARWWNKKTPEQQEEYKQKYIRSEAHIRNNLRQSGGWKDVEPYDIPQEIVDLKKAMLELVRIGRKAKQEEKNNEGNAEQGHFNW